MDESVGNQLLIDHIKQLEEERDKLQREIEQLHVHQSRSSYLAADARNSRRASGLEQEIDNLKASLEVCKRDNHNLHEKLSEAYRIKSQLADLHDLEVSKKLEVEKQLSFYQSCIASAFADRDKSLLEAEKAKDEVERLSNRLDEQQKRVNKLLQENSDLMCQRCLLAEMQQLEVHSSSLGNVIDKFYEIRQRHMGKSSNTDMSGKCDCLLRDASDLWSFNYSFNTSSTTYIKSVREKNLEKEICASHEGQVNSMEAISQALSLLSSSHAHLKDELMGLLAEEQDQLLLWAMDFYEKLKFHLHRELPTEYFSDASACLNAAPKRRQTIDDMSSSIYSNLLRKESDDAADALERATQEKVAALLLLSKQEERHLFYEDMNASLHKKISELQQCLFQVTSEKVKALLELAQVRQEYNLLQLRVSDGVLPIRHVMGKSGMTAAVQEKWKKLLKHTRIIHGDHQEVHS